MPKRTNTFQRLAAILHEKLGSGWRVSESELLRDAITGKLREVDVVAKSVDTHYEMVISVECRDHARRTDVTWIEAMAKKHESLPTSKLVLWSRSGFSNQALTKARALNIEALSHEDAADAPWAQIARKMVGGAVELLTPQIVPFIDAERPDKSRVRLRDVHASPLLDAEGEVAVTILQIIAFLRKSHQVGSTLLDNSVPGTQEFYIEYRPSEPRFVEDGEGNRLRVLRVGFGVQAHVEKVQLAVASAAWKEKVATLGTARAESGDFELLVEEAKDEQAKVHAVFKPERARKRRRTSGTGNE